MMYAVPGDSGNLLAPLVSQTVSWQLYFDRTYELNYGGNSSAVNDPAVIGVQADIYQFLQFTGLLATLDKSQATASARRCRSDRAGCGEHDRRNHDDDSVVRILRECARADVARTAGNSNLNAIGSQLAYYGFISEWTVTYTHFTASMVPIRASISITFTHVAESAGHHRQRRLAGRVGSRPGDRRGSAAECPDGPAHYGHAGRSRDAPSGRTCRVPGSWITRPSAWSSSTRRPDGPPADAVVSC